MSFRALVFDCDGVLADTERDGHRPAFNATFDAFGVPVVWDVEEYGRLVEIGGGKERMGSLFSGPLAGSEWDGDEESRKATLAAWHKDKTARYIELIDSGAIPGRPGVRELAQEAADAGILLACASTSAEASVRAVLRNVMGEELAGRFAVFAGDVVPAKKPAPDIYLHAVQHLGVEPGEAVAVEDSGIGCKAAVTAGLTTVITTSAYTAADDFTGAALVVPSLEHTTLSDIRALLP